MPIKSPNNGNPPLAPQTGHWAQILHWSGGSHCGAGATIFLCYAFSISSILFLLALAACEFGLVLGLARVGLAGVMARILGDHLAVLSVFCGSFWLRKGLEFRIPLPADAPGLFAMLKNNGGTDQRVTGVGAGTSTISNDIA